MEMYELQPIDCQKQHSCCPESLFCTNCLLIVTNSNHVIEHMKSHGLFSPDWLRIMLKKYVYVHACVCVCARACACTCIQLHICVCVYIYMYIIIPFYGLIGPLQSIIFWSSSSSTFIYLQKQTFLCVIATDCKRRLC